MITRKQIGNLLLVLVLMVTIGGGFGVGAGKVEAQETVRVMVRLRDVEGDINERSNIRQAVREVRRISNRAPRQYSVDGEKRLASDMRKWRVVEVQESELDEVLLELDNNVAVVEARVEQIYRQVGIPNDSLFGAQYGLFNSKGPLTDINAVQAWDKTVGTTDMVIAIVDGGVDLTHEDLRDKAWRNSGEVAGNELDDDGNGYVDDVNGWDYVTNSPAAYAHTHGTHVAGIAAADSNNGKGIAGANWRARIMSVRVLGRSGTGREADIAAGINYATANGAKIINLSIAGRKSKVIEDAIENAYASGVVVVAAAGNNGADTGRLNLAPVCSEPNDVNMVIGVGATDDDGEPTSFSNYGKCVDISAPGKRIISTIPGNRYKKMSGTSMSSPLVAGVAGLYMALHPGAGTNEILEAINGSKRLFVGRYAEKWNSRYKGLLDAAKLLGATVDEEAEQNNGPSLPSSGQSSSNDEFKLRITKQGSAEITPGNNIIYRITVNNVGTGKASEVRVEDRFNRDLMFAGDLSSSGCYVERRNVICNIGELVGGLSKELRLVYRLDSEARCRSRLRDKAIAYAQERGRSRRQAKSERVDTRVVCE